ncbi:hypothetical protein OF83DRAFT_1029799, partial [Amylostereum chailletii]
LDTLPVELLYEIHFYALSEFLPHASRRLHAVFKSAPPTVHAEYLLGRCLPLPKQKPHACPIARALRYPICTQPVLDALLRHPSCPEPSTDPLPLPRRLFPAGAPPPGGFKDRHAPLPFLRHLFSHPRLPTPDPNSHDGYPLVRAVVAGHTPLVRFLLDHGAAPKRKDGLAVLAAIRRRDLALVKLLVEPPAQGGQAARGKRRRMPDRVEVGPLMLKTAVQCQADDIVEYLMKEKGCVPDMKTITMV